MVVPNKPMSRSTAWKRANRERYNEYQKEYMRAKRKQVPLSSNDEVIVK